MNEKSEIKKKWMDQVENGKKDDERMNAKDSKTYINMLIFLTIANVYFIR